MSSVLPGNMRTVLLSLLAFALAMLVCACAAPPESRDSSSAGDIPAPSDAATGEDAQNQEQDTLAPVVYPTAWLAMDAEGISAGTAVQVLYLPGFSIAAHAAGQDVAGEDEGEFEDLRDASPDMAIVEHQGERMAIDPVMLLVNLPDVLDAARFDVVYAYASTSAAAGERIPGVTGERLPGYPDGKQYDAYLDKREFAVPCAYGTALKARTVAQALSTQGYRLLVFDAYRPMTAQLYLSDALQRAYAESPAIQSVLDSWGSDWYVAPGASGHNFGTDLDVGICDAAGEPLAMPSAFDAFDESGHLTQYPMSPAEITPDAYRVEVQENEACLALHEAFVEAGFSELASEWWHFADDETETQMRALVGDAGLDFVAVL